MNAWDPTYAWDRWEARLVKALAADPANENVRLAIEQLRQLRQEKMPR